MVAGVRRYRLDADFGRIRTGKFDYAFVPSHRTKLHPVILFHQAGPTYVGQYAASATPISSSLGPKLAREGFVVISGELDGTAATGYGFGIDSSIGTDADAALALAATLSPGVDISHVHTIGTSMGAFAALRRAVERPNTVKSITTLVGLTDMMTTYDAVPAQQANMLAAWGVANRAALAASAAGLLYNRLTELAGTPTKLYYSSADTTVLPATQTGAQAKIGSSAVATVVSASLDHVNAEAIIAAVRDRGVGGNWAEVVAHLSSSE